MRSSRGYYGGSGGYGGYKSDNTGGNGVKVFAIIAVCVLAYFICAGVAGKWIAENIIKPVAQVFMPESGYAGDIAENDEKHALFAEDSEKTAEPSAAAAESPKEAEITSRKLTLPDMTVYALQTGVYSVAQNADEACAEAKSRGGAGYIYKDGELMRVMLAAYPTLEEAKSVMASLLENENTETWEYVIEAKGPEMSVSASEESIGKIEGFFSFAEESKGALYDISVAFESGNMTAEDTQSALLALESAREEQEKALLALEARGGEEIAAMSAYARDMSDCFKIGEGDKTKVEISSRLKYNYIMYCEKYIGFLSGFAD